MSVCWYADPNRGLIQNSVAWCRWHSAGEACWSSALWRRAKGWAKEHEIGRGIRVGFSHRIRTHARFSPSDLTCVSFMFNGRHELVRLRKITSCFIIMLTIMLLWIQNLFIYWSPLTFWIPSFALLFCLTKTDISTKCSACLWNWMPQNSKKYQWCCHWARIQHFGRIWWPPFQIFAFHELSEPWWFDPYTQFNHIITVNLLQLGHLSIRLYRIMRCFAQPGITTLICL